MTRLARFSWSFLKIQTLKKSFASKGTRPNPLTIGARACGISEHDGDGMTSCRYEAIDLKEWEEAG